MPQDTEDFANSGPLPLVPADLDELARWVPKKEMALLIDLCERARRDPDLARPALLLCWAYGQKVARMLDQDPFPSVTRKIATRLQELASSSGL
jgi:predicted nicotinamide N-methyase